MHPTDPFQFGVKKALVESGIVSDDMTTCHKIRKLGHHLFTTRLRFQHLIGDSGIPLDERADPEAWVHQLLEAIDNRAILDEHSPDLDRPVAILGRQPRSLEVKNDYRVR